ncbi:MBOAT family protein [Meridianimaribacter sp. CL38]|nr:MBOAT family protein [Meridianimaribacter sp. CL38]
MLFSSPVFLFAFLPLVILLYLIIPKRVKNFFLLLVSVLFYTWGEKELVILILLSAIVDYCCGLIINSGKRKVGLFISVFFNLGILIYFKYSNFVFSNLCDLLSVFNVSIENSTRFADVVLPLGISFYTFQTMSYTIDVYRGTIKANKNFIDFATYVTLFPQLIAGPIVRYSEIQHELKNRKVTVDSFSKGVERFIIGLAKKMIIANNCAYLADAIFNLPDGEMSAITAWLGVIAYSFQIYYDFSGYSDMAIGIGKMLGFNFPENFNFPYISKTVQEFWRRWHMTLSNWFKDYVYISLGGNRKGNNRTYFNLMIVFFVTGLWHGASWTFIVWGLFHGLFIIIERIGLKKVLVKNRIVSHFYLLLIVTVSWVFFRSDNLSYAFNYLTSMFSFNSSINLDFIAYYLNKEVAIALILALVFSMPIYKFIKARLLHSQLHQLNKSLLLLRPVGLTVLFIICCMYIASDSYNPFIYFRF